MATEQSILAVIRAAPPSFRNRYDKAAFAVHSAFVAAGYVLHATGPSAFADDVLSSSLTDEVGMNGWNEFEDNYAFLYSYPDKNPKKVLMKCLVMNEKLLVNVLRDGDLEPLRLEIEAEEHVEDYPETSYASQVKNLSKLVADVNKEILDKLSVASTPSSSSQPSSSGTILREDRPRLAIDNLDNPYAPAPGLRSASDPQSSTDSSPPSSPLPSSTDSSPPSSPLPSSTDSSPPSSPPPPNPQLQFACFKTMLQKEFGKMTMLRNSEIKARRHSASHFSHKRYYWLRNMVGNYHSRMERIAVSLRYSSITVGEDDDFHALVMLRKRFGFSGTMIIDMFNYGYVRRAQAMVSKYKAEGFDVEMDE